MSDDNKTTKTTKLVSINTPKNQFVRDMMDVEKGIAAADKEESYEMISEAAFATIVFVLMTGALRDYRELEETPLKARTLEWYDTRSQLREEIMAIVESASDETLDEE